MFSLLILSIIASTTTTTTAATATNVTTFGVNCTSMGYIPVFVFHNDQNIEGSVSILFSSLRDGSKLIGYLIGKKIVGLKNSRPNF